MDLCVVAAHILTHLPVPSARWPQPVLLGIFGVPGSGKTEIARYLQQRHPLLILSTDALRLHYGLASGLATRQMMDQLATTLLPQHIGVVFDGLHLSRTDRQVVQQLAHCAQAVSWLLYVTADPSVIDQRLQMRLRRAEQTTAEGKFVIRPEHFRRIVSYLEPPAPDEAVITVDTSCNDVGEQLKELDGQLTKLLQGG
jgi:predicted kinase